MKYIKYDSAGAGVTLLLNVTPWVCFAKPRRRIRYNTLNTIDVIEYIKYSEI